MALVLLSLWVGSKLGCEAGEPPSTYRQQHSAETQRCLRDIECVKQQHQWESEAELFCRMQIDANALYGAYWLDTPRIFKMFDGVRLNPPGYDTAVYFGSSVLYRTADGQFDAMRYECFYDPIRHEVVGLII